MFKKGQKVVKVINIQGIKTASVVEIARKKKELVQCEGDEHIWYHAATGSEHEPAIPGCSSMLITLTE